MPGRLGFPKRARLLERAEFLAVQQKGKGFADGPLAVSYLWQGTGLRDGDMMAAAEPRLRVPRVGLTVSSKVGGAVVRNRVKRKLREAVRNELSGLPAVDMVIVARASAVSGSVADFREWLKRAAVRMQKGAGR